ncbi:hypothetical protein ACPC54_18780 [Kitasatospora sp. NPDC094028]
MDWDLPIGATVPLKDLPNRYGGRLQGRIRPSRTEHLLLISDASSVHDGWTGHRYMFTGEGSREGHHRIAQGNAALLGRRRTDQTLRLFHHLPDGDPRYLGRYAVDPDLPYVHADLPGEFGPIRGMVFRLVPLDGAPTGVRSTVDAPRGRPRVEQTALDPQLLHAAGDRRAPAGAQLLARYCQRQRQRGHSLARLVVTPAGDLTAISSDLYDLTANELVTVVADGSRDTLHRAVGLLDDLARYADPGVGRALLLAEQPDRDLRLLAAQYGITLIWPTAEGAFARKSQPQSVLAQNGVAA